MQVNLSNVFYIMILNTGVSIFEIIYNTVLFLCEANK